MKFFKFFLFFSAALLLAAYFSRLFHPRNGGYAFHDFNEEWIA